MQQNQTKRWEHIPLEELSNVAKELMCAFSKPHFFAIQGEMGAGKTTFVQSILKELGIPHPDGSPTYAIVHEYLSTSGVKAYHLDCYRIENERDLAQLGLEELFEENAYFFVEWPDKIENILPDDANWLYIRCEAESELREIVLNYDN
ncbi:MAG: tRNA (adenosine(37)-N6)-threonylcarbamoyltransferase complex ATPase subunit type 1 TsaE [Flavobacteriales bacterium]